MKNITIKCTLCCDQTFDSKLTFANHLASVLANISCPVCNNKWASIAHLIEHLNLDNCEPDSGIHHLVENNDHHINEIVNVNDEIIECDDKKHIKIFEETTIPVQISDDKELVTTEALDTNKNIYLEILDKSDDKSCITNKDLKFVEGDDGMEQYVFMTNELDLEGTVVTKQNSDGTISLETVKDMKVVSQAETVIAPSENEVTDSQEELYSCNTCGVSFSSVLEHIQNYHNDQEVVVEESIEDGNILTQEFDIESQTPVEIKHDGTKRVITDNGDIINVSDLNDMEIADPPVPSPNSAQVVKPYRQDGKRFVQIAKFCDSVVQNINPQETGGPYHKVIVKEVIVNGEKMKTYFCMSCNIYVSKLDDFKNHPCNIFKYPCPHCPVAYENSKSLCAHMKVHKTKNNEMILPVVVAKPFVCEICKTKFPTNKSLKLHKRMHAPIKTRPIDPPVETSPGVEGSTGRYRCNECDQLIPIDYRALHQKSHTQNNQMNCTICNKKFDSTEYLEMHMNVHNTDKVHVNKTDKTLPYSCLYCDRCFARPHEKVKHERIHTGEKPHSCQICGKSFRVAYCLTIHMRTHTGARPYACPICGKRFKAHSVYNHHLQTHSEVRRYKCPFCPKAFKTSVQLAGHKNSHTKPFSCQHCNRPFASLYAVRVHSETHARQNNLKFVCTLCGASYARAFALKDHIRQLHPQQLDTAVLTEVVEEKGDDEWVIKDNSEIKVVELPSISRKVLTEAITELEMTTDEL